jgi:hypothetical protein
MRLSNTGNRKPQGNKRLQNLVKKTKKDLWRLKDKPPEMLKNAESM